MVPKPGARGGEGRETAPGWGGAAWEPGALFVTTDQPPGPEEDTQGRVRTDKWRQAAETAWLWRAECPRGRSVEGVTFEMALVRGRFQAEVQEEGEA